MTHARRALAIIDLQALRHNLQRVRRAAPASKVMAVVKADGYGHGLVRVARQLDADAYAVACLDEALALREAGIQRPIVLLEGFSEPQELEPIRRYSLDAVVHHRAQLDILEHAGASPIKVWLKIDSGMHRLGFPPEEVPDAWRRANACAAAAKPLRFMTHLANADARGDARTARQLEVFHQALGGRAGERSIANSAAILAWPQSHVEWVRPGLMLYGASPFIGGRAEQEGLQPVMTLGTRLIAVNAVKKGEAVGYGGTWVCPRDMRIGVAAIGYGDGYPRHAANGTPVLVNGRRTALVGRVSMDMVCVDLSEQPEARIGDPVVLWGKELPVEEVAQHAATIPYELLCGVTRRVAFCEV
ncbi:MAG: alanine racemase [Gammaproteobacteria bacterium]|nr:alanine racemase [Gammaproteobacteria bacterium]